MRWGPFHGLIPLGLLLLTTAHVACGDPSHKIKPVSADTPFRKTLAPLYARPRLARVDVNRAASSANGNGRGNFSQSPGVRSDPLALPAFDLIFKGRGPARTLDRPVWSTLNDSIQRIHRNLKPLNPGIAGSKAEPPPKIDDSHFEYDGRAVIAEGPPIPGGGSRPAL